MWGGGVVAFCVAVKERGGHRAGECVQQLQALLHAMHQGGFV